MAELITTGDWTLNPGKETAFVDAWASFAEWATTMPGAGRLRLGRDLGDPARFVSYAAWDDDEAVQAWKTQPEFRERLAQVLQHVEDFHPSELAVVAATGRLEAAAQHTREEHDQWH